VHLEYITDPTDERILGYRDLTDVALRTRIEPETGVFIAESAAVIERAIAAGYQPSRCSRKTNGWSGCNRSCARCRTYRSSSVIDGYWRRSPASTFTAVPWHS